MVGKDNSSSVFDFGITDKRLRPRRPTSPVRNFKTLQKQTNIIDNKYAEKPEMTREYAEKLRKSESEPLLKFKWVDNFKNPNFIVPGNNKTSYKVNWDIVTPDMCKPKPDPGKMKIKPQWYPKDLAVSLPRVKFYSIDPVYYENPPKHLIENTFGAHKPPPMEEPRFVGKWKSQEGWNNKSLRGCFKITEHPAPPKHLM